MDLSKLYCFKLFYISITNQILVLSHPIEIRDYSNRVQELQKYSQFYFYIDTIEI